MKTKTFLILAVVAAIVVIAAAVVQRQDRPATPNAATAPRLFPGLADKLNAVVEISIKAGDKAFNFRKTAAGWELAEKNGYAAKPEEIRKAMVGLSELREGEPKTSKPDLYAKIGVQDPDGKAAEPGAAAPTLITLKDDKGATIAAAIVGSPKYGSPPGVYIRKAGEPQGGRAPIMVGRGAT
jgi:hypothetical protein